MDILLIYSNKCKHSQNIKNYKIFNEIDKLNIDNKNEIKQLPKYVKSVPTLIIKKNEKITILKDKDLLQWIQINSNNTNSVYNNNTTKEEKCEVNECNTLVNDKFSSDFSFIDSKSDNLLENFYSSIDNNTVIDTPSTENTKQNKTLDNDFEKLIQERNNEFKSIDRH